MSLQITFTKSMLEGLSKSTIARLRRVKAEIGELQEQADILTERIKSALGDAIIGTVNGAPAVKWSLVESSRIDIKKAREVLPQQVLDLLEVRSQSRRFTLLDGGEQW
jgi:predicted phage-related endonuclease